MTETALRRRRFLVLLAAALGGSRRAEAQALPDETGFSDFGARYLGPQERFALGNQLETATTAAERESIRANHRRMVEERASQELLTADERARYRMRLENAETAQVRARVEAERRATLHARAGPRQPQGSAGPARGPQGSGRGGGAGGGRGGPPR